jgi:hypothetical protein
MMTRVQAEIAVVARRDIGLCEDDSAVMSLAVDVKRVVAMAHSA